MRPASSRLGAAIARTAVKCARIGMWVSALSIAGMMLITTLGTITRAGFNYGIEGTDEVVGILMVLSLYMGLAYTFLEDGLIRIEFVRVKLSPRARRACEVVLVALAAVTTLVIAGYFWRGAWISAARNVQSVGALTMPLYPWEMAMALGMTLLLFAIVARLLQPADTAIAPPSATPRTFET